MENRVNTIENILYSIAFFLCAFLFILLQFLTGKIISAQLSGALGIFTSVITFSVFTILLGLIISRFAKKIPLRFQVMLNCVLLLASACFFKIPIELISPFDFDILTPQIISLLILFKFSFLPSVTLVTIINILPFWHKIETGSNNLKMFEKIGSLGILLPFFLYPFVYENSLSTLQNYKIFYCAFAFLFVLMYLISIFFVAKTQDLLKQDTEPCEFKNKETAISLFYGAFTGFVFLSFANYIVANTISTPLLWSIISLCLVFSTLSTFYGFKLTSRKWNLTFLWLIFLIFTAIKISDMSFVKNPFLYLTATIFALFVFVSTIQNEFCVKNKKFENRTISNFVFIFGFFISALLINYVIPYILNVQIEHIIAAILVYIYATYLFIPFVKGQNMKHEEIEHFMLIISLSLILISTFITDKNLKFYKNAQIRDFNSIYEIKADRITGIKALYNNNRVIATQGYDAKEGKYDITPLGFYGGYSGFTAILNNLQLNKKTLKIAKIGLGAGSIASYLREGDKLTYFESNKSLIGAVEKHFSHIKTSKGEIDFKIGNPRILLANMPSQNYDLILVDLTANKNDPTSLVTKEAFELYKRHTKADGVILFNITRKNLNFIKILKKTAQDNKLSYSLISTQYPRRFAANFSSQFFAIYMPKNKIYKNIKNLKHKNNNDVTIKNVNIENMPVPKGDFTDNNSSLFPLYTFGLIFK